MTQPPSRNDNMRENMEVEPPYFLIHGNTDKGQIDRRINLCAFETT